jgi:hypothetical protein
VDRGHYQLPQPGDPPTTKANELERLLPWAWQAEQAGPDLKAAA